MMMLMGPPGVHLADKKRSMMKGSDSERRILDMGGKRRETVIPGDARVNLGDDFFYDI